MATHGTREDLRGRVIEAFAAQDEIYRICTFGREAEGKHDRYSDIDVVVYSRDPIRSLENSLLCPRLTPKLRLDTPHVLCYNRSP